MLISLDRNRCRKCGVCIDLMEGYCIERVDGYPQFDSVLCNTCQKCVAVCPHQAILVNGTGPRKIENVADPEVDAVYSMLERRRSTKRFKDKPIPREIVETIVSTAGFTPNQNKNISVHAIDDKSLIASIDRSAMKFVKSMYGILFGFRPLTIIFSWFLKDLPVIKRKMEFGNFRRVIYENAQVVILVSGKKSVPVTESSSHYVLATMMFMAETLGVNSCLMDSIYLGLRLDRAARKTLGITEDILGAMILGYSDERIMNIPQGYVVPTEWNSGHDRNNEGGTIPTS